MLGNFGKTLWSRQRRARLHTCSQCTREVRVREKKPENYMKAIASFVGMNFYARKYCLYLGLFLRFHKRALHARYNAL